LRAGDAAIVVKTGDGRTGDRHEFHLSESLVHAASDASGSAITIFAIESALPDGTYEPSAGTASRYFRLQMSREQARGLQRSLSAALRNAVRAARR
jgi:hypothetical protein